MYKGQHFTSFEGKIKICYYAFPIIVWLFGCQLKKKKDEYFKATHKSTQYLTQ